MNSVLLPNITENILILKKIIPLNSRKDLLISSDDKTTVLSQQAHFWRAEKRHYIINVLSWMKGLCIWGAYERGRLYEREWQRGISHFPSCLSRANRLYRSHSTVRSLTALALFLHHLYHVKGFVSFTLMRLPSGHGPGVDLKVCTLLISIDLCSNSRNRV